MADERVGQQLASSHDHPPSVVQKAASGMMDGRAQGETALTDMMLAMGRRRGRPQLQTRAAADIGVAGKS